MVVGSSGFVTRSACPGFRLSDLSRIGTSYQAESPAVPVTPKLSNGAGSDPQFLAVELHPRIPHPLGELPRTTITEGPVLHPGVRQADQR